jgi:hypothetical protein
LASALGLSHLQQVQSEVVFNRDAEPVGTGAATLMTSVRNSSLKFLVGYDQEQSEQLKK